MRSLFRQDSLLTAALLFVFAAGSLGLQPAQKDAVEAARLNNLGVAYLNQRRSELALKSFEQARTLDPALFVARLNEGIALLDVQRSEEAERVLLEATRQQPNNPRAWFNLGLLYRKEDETEKALNAFQRVAQIDPDDDNTHYFQGALYQAAKQPERAIASYRRALELNPFHVSALFGLANVYQRRGDREEARKYLDRFQKLTQEKLGSPVGTVYGDQGKYSLAEDARLPAGVATPPIAVQFVTVPGAQSGLLFGPTAKPQTAAPSVLGACFLDYNNDTKIDLLVLTGGPAGVALFKNADGRFTNVTGAARLTLTGRATSCISGDYDNDGWTDVIIGVEPGVRLFRNQGDGTYRDVTESAGLRSVGAAPAAMTLADYDHDGDVDLELVIAGQLALWRNNGNGTFTDISSATLPGEIADAHVSIATDFDNDRAVDFVVTRGHAPASLLRNPREGKFPGTPLFGAASQARTRGVVTFDFDSDGWMDMAFTEVGSPGLSLWRNIKGKRLEPVPLPKLDATDCWGLAALDYDNDGRVDLAAVGSRRSIALRASEPRGFDTARHTTASHSTAAGSQVFLLRNEGNAGFRPMNQQTGLDRVNLDNPGSLITADYDADGDADLLITQDGNPPVLLRNDGGNKNNWVRFSFKALADNRAGIGTKLEVFAGALYQKFEVQSSTGYLGQNGPEIVVGVGQAKEADIVRLLWPTGVLQDEVQLAANQAHQLAETDRRGSSCPILFAWDGAHYRFVSDLIGPGTVGHWVEPGVRNTADPTEYVKVAADQLRTRDGRLSLRLIESMEEVVYLDQVRLLAIDHPASVAVDANERFASTLPFPDFRVIASSQARLPVGAWDERGRDITRELAARDRGYVTGFRPLPYTGFAELHGVELELGAWNPAEPLRLLMHGFTDYFTATSTYAAHQAGIRAIPPYLEAQDAAGKWQRVIDDLGFPAGLARTMVADLTGRLPAGTKRVRIMTNLRVYWDQILVDTSNGGDLSRVSEAPLVEARLGFRGYPREVRGNPPSDISYVYQDVSATGPFARHAGNYTRYGGVSQLLTDADDRFTIFGSGDEVQLEFDSSNLAPVPAGWVRDYFFYADGFCKDMDFYGAYGYTVEPLPFHAMRGYPYEKGKSYSGETDYLDYQLEMNTRQVSGREAAGYRYEYRRR